MLVIRAVNLYRRKFDDVLLHVEGVVRRGLGRGARAWS
jgi:hypothetical protein